MVRSVRVVRKLIGREGKRASGDCSLHAPSRASTPPPTLINAYGRSRFGTGRSPYLLADVFPAGVRPVRVCCLSLVVSCVRALLLLLMLRVLSAHSAAVTALCSLSGVRDGGGAACLSRLGRQQSQVSPMYSGLTSFVLGGWAWVWRAHLGPPHQVSTGAWVWVNQGLLALRP